MNDVQFVDIMKPGCVYMCVWVSVGGQWRALGM